MRGEPIHDVCVREVGNEPASPGERYDPQGRLDREEQGGVRQLDTLWRACRSRGIDQCQDIVGVDLLALLTQIDRLPRKVVDAVNARASVLHAVEIEDRTRNAGGLDP